MTSVAKLLENKAPEVWSIGPSESVYDAIKLMDEKGVGALTVLLDDKLVGILSERDYARKVVLKGRSSKDTLVKDIMITHVFYTFPEQNIEECMVVMTEHHIRHLPVLLDNQLTGMISLGDVVKEIIREQKIKIEHLEHYIIWEESY